MEHGTHDPLLLTTKLSIPSNYQKHIISRDMLYERFDAALHRPLLLVSAPAGCGKTTSVSAWVRQRQLSVAWVTLERSDNDLQRFWRYITSALQQFSPELDIPYEQWSSMPQVEHFETMLTNLINILVRQGQEVVLILDDYHTITTEAIHRTFAFLLEHLPPQFHVIILSRIDPPLPLARLRVQGKLTEIRAECLRFSREEMQHFLAQSMHVQLEEREMHELERRTEGWIAGLQVAALALQRKESPAAIQTFIKTFTGANRHLLHYFDDEVLAQQSPEMQNFLFVTSILESFNASLCDAVTERQDSEMMLVQLEQLNLFLLPLDNHQEWFRYRYLFADALRVHLKDLDEQYLADRYFNASIWYEQHAMMREAIYHAQRAGRGERLTFLLEEHAWEMIQQGDEHLVAQALAQVPEAMISASPILTFITAYIHFLQAQMEAYEQTLMQAESQWQETQNTLMLGRIYELRACVAAYCGDSVQAIRYGQQALAMTPGEHPSLYGSALVSVGIGYLLYGDLMHAREALIEGYRLSQRSTQPAVLMSAALYSGVLSIAQGNLRAAVQTLQQIATTATTQDIWYHTAVHTLFATIYYEWNELSSAREHLQQAMQSPQVEFDGLIVAQRYMLAAHLAWLDEEYDQALSLLDQGEQYVRRPEVHTLALLQMNALRIRFLLKRNDLLQAQHWLTQHNAHTDGSMYEHEVYAISQARVLLAQDQVLEAIDVLTALLEQVQEQERVESEVRIQIVLTLAYHVQGNTQRTLQALERALLLAEPGGYMRIFVDEGDIMAALLTELYSRHQRKSVNEAQLISKGYLYTVLGAFGEEVAPPVWSTSAGNDDVLIDKLSEREYMVLVLIAEGLSNQEIAQKLVVTVSTIKTHLNNIYAKLHVHTRLQAVTRAYDLGLLRRTEIDTEPLAHPLSGEKV
ncbi:MAG TPA: LuxR C-terminal-related transcriptional regulator [Dictyobacter sp.]|nr:LuxR C-terminal-related transcriptional regulator [Dictyobacter sp.]